MNFLTVATLLASTASAKIFFHDSFDDANWQSRWHVPSKANVELGNWEISSGKFFADEKINQGLKTVDNMRFYLLTAPFSEPVTNAEGNLVVQLSAKHEQNLNCGGGYIKLLNAETDVDSFNAQTAFDVMFGPDLCGPNRRVHVILRRGDTGRMIKRRIDFPNDELTHMYTLILSQPAQTYRVLVDGVEVASGNIVDDFEGMSDEPRMIPDPSAVKPADWDDRRNIPDPEDVKPADWDTEHPRTVADPEAKQPEDWDEATQGVWTAPQIDNPHYVEWKPRMIPNPNFQGVWTAPQVPNPAFKADPKLAVFDRIGHVAFDLWQVKAGTIFDNVLVTDDVSVAQKQLEDLFMALKEAEAKAERAWFAAAHPEAAAQAEQAIKDAEAFKQATEDQFGSVEEFNAGASSSDSEQTEL